MTGPGDWRVQFLDAYRRSRVDDQLAYYGRRSREFDRAQRWSARIAAVLLVVAAMCGALGIAVPSQRGMWAFLAATVAAVATAVTACEAAFGYERGYRQFRDTRLALRRTDEAGPQPEDLSGGDADARLGAYVGEVEGLLRAEVEGWAVHVRAPAPGEPPPS